MGVRRCTLGLGAQQLPVFAHEYGLSRFLARASLRILILASCLAIGPGFRAAAAQTAPSSEVSAACQAEIKELTNLLDQVIGQRDGLAQEKDELEGLLREALERDEPEDARCPEGQLGQGGSLEEADLAAKNEELNRANTDLAQQILILNEMAERRDAILEALRAELAASERDLSEARREVLDRGRITSAWDAASAGIADFVQRILISKIGDAITSDHCADPLQVEIATNGEFPILRVTATLNDAAAREGLRAALEAHLPAEMLVLQLTSPDPLNCYRSLPSEGDRTWRVFTGPDGTVRPVTQPALERLIDFADGRGVEIPSRCLDAGDLLLAAIKVWRSEVGPGAPSHLIPDHFWSGIPGQIAVCARQGDAWGLVTDPPGGSTGLFIFRRVEASSEDR